MSSDQAKVACIISHLSSQAESWVTAEWNRRSAVCKSLSLLRYSPIFEMVSPGCEAARYLVALRQGKRRVTNYVIEFGTLAVESGWNQSALSDAFFGLHYDFSSFRDRQAIE